MAFGKCGMKMGDRKRLDNIKMAIWMVFGNIGT